MNKQALIEKLNSMLAGRSPEQQLFIKLVQQVWEIDPYESVYSVFSAMRGKDMGYFFGFMEQDGEGVDSNEMGLIRQLITSYDYYSCYELIDELNEARESVR